MKPVIFLVYLALSGIAAYQGYMIFYPHTAEQKTAVMIQKNNDADRNEDRLSHQPQKGHDKKIEAEVIKRNLFKVMIDLPAARSPESVETTQAAPEKTKLKLALWGTVAGVTPSRNWAVIENQKTRKQDLYMAGDRILGAKIKKVSRNRVILTVDGKDQMLESQTKPSPGASFPQNIPSQGLSGPPTKGTQTSRDIFKSLKFRPYMKEGSPSGVLIYGIRPKSKLRSIGLKNGDIIQTINETEIITANDFKAVIQTLTADSAIDISMFRRGQEKEIFYKGAE